MKPYLHGTTSSSLNEVRLGKEEFGDFVHEDGSVEKKEMHAYSVAYSANEIDDVLIYADKVNFNTFN